MNENRSRGTFIAFFSIPARVALGILAVAGGGAAVLHSGLAGWNDADRQSAVQCQTELTDLKGQLTDTRRALARSLDEGEEWQAWYEDAQSEIQSVGTRSSAPGFKYHVDALGTRGKK